jgi:hypothetical protein
MSVTHCVTFAKSGMIYRTRKSLTPGTRFNPHQSKFMYFHFGCQNIILISITRGYGLVFTFPGTDINTGRKTGYFLLFPDINGNAKISRTTRD